MIRSTRHHLKDLNDGKFQKYLEFLAEYDRVCRIAIDTIWNQLPEDLDIPKYFDYKAFGFETNLSARALSSIVTQASGIVRSAITKQKKRLWVIKNKNANVKTLKFSKPELPFIAPSISSKCCDIEIGDKSFFGFLRLKSIGKYYGNIKIPIIRHPRSKGALKNGVILFKHKVQLTWEVPTSPISKGSKVLGIDQGYKNVASLSDGQVTPKHCNHGHSLESIIGKLSRRQKGSKGFRRAIAHRKNFINFSINSLNFEGVSEIRLEKITNIRYRKRSSRKLSHWSNPEIRDKILRRCEELEVPVIEQSCAYRSQRCYNCGYVRKSNRKKDRYDCACGYKEDADINAARNHSVDLPAIPYDLRCQKQNLKGFYWNPEGFVIDGKELRVPCAKQNV